MAVYSKSFPSWKQSDPANSGRKKKKYWGTLTMDTGWLSSQYLK